jgi:nucleoside-diphosphate-sugar epimerase
MGTLISLVLLILAWLFAIPVFLFCIEIVAALVGPQRELLLPARNGLRRRIAVIVPRGDPITLYGDGKQTRSFCYVDDLIEGLIRLMDSPAAVTGPINLGNPVEFMMLELAELVLAETGSSSRLVQKPLPQDDPRQRQPDITLAKKYLDWIPSVTLRAGLKPTAAYFRGLLPDLSENWRVNSPAAL